MWLSVHLVWGIHESLHPAQTALQRPTQQRLAEECLSEDWIELTPMGTKQLVDGSSWRTASDSYTSHSSGVSWGGHPKMGAKSRKVLTTNRLLKGPHWATLSREDYLLGLAEFCILKLGLSRASCYRKKQQAEMMSWHFSDGLWFRARSGRYVLQGDPAAQEGMMQNLFIITVQ